jgi:hypothetical protein
MHNISGVVTSFKYMGPLPFVYLVGNHAFIPLDRGSPGFKGYPIVPFDALTLAIKNLAKTLSFSGICAYVETLYFGGEGGQASMAWKNGRCVFEENTEVDAINQVLRFMGILRHEGKDEFDTARLGWYRFNEEVIEDFSHGNIHGSHWGR